MKPFESQHCGQLLNFENTSCERCGYVSGYLPHRTMLSARTADGAKRERHRRNLAEADRALLEHFRQECGQHFWERFVRDSVWHGAIPEAVRCPTLPQRSILRCRRDHGGEC